MFQRIVQLCLMVVGCNSLQMLTKESWFYMEVTESQLAENLEPIAGVSMITAGINCMFIQNCSIVCPNVTSIETSFFYMSEVLPPSTCGGGPGMECWSKKYSKLHFTQVNMILNF